MAGLNPSSWYKFAGNGNDSGSSVSNLTEQGTPTYVASLVPSEAGLAGNAVQLDGTADYFTGADIYDFSGSFGNQKFSIAFWIKVESANFGSGSQRIISKRVTTGDLEGWVVHGTSTGDLAIVFDYGTTDESSFPLPDLDENEVHFVVITWDSAVPEIRTYVDGSLLSFDNTGWTTAIPDTTGLLAIGAEANGNRKFQGVLDEPAIWDGTVLSSTNVTALWISAQSGEVFLPARRRGR